MQLVIFDCDGVLVDSEIIGDRVVLDYLREQQPEIDWPALQIPMTGVRVAEILAEAKIHSGVSFPADASVLIEQELRAAFDNEMEPISGIAEALAAIRLPKAVASNSSSLYVAEVLARFGLESHFRGRVVGADKVERPKPDPDVYLLAAELGGAEPSDCLVIEDSVPGVRAATAAGMTVVGFLGGSHVSRDHADRLRDAGASHIVTAMQDLPVVIDYHITGVTDM